MALLEAIYLVTIPEFTQHDPCDCPDFYSSARSDYWVLESLSSSLENIHCVKACTYTAMR